MDDYKDKLISELKDINDKLIDVNKKQIEVNMKFANVTEKNNDEYQKTFRWLIVIGIGAITAVCIGAMIIFSARINGYDLNKNININRNTTTEGSG